MSPEHPAPRMTTVSFDLRRTLINVLGEEHYPHAEHLYHELAANAYDEDATEVLIVEDIVQAERRGKTAVYNLTVRDDGNGMDIDRLREYFTVGQSGKPERRVSERFARPLIGRIGVGKVANLKVARQWTILTERHLGLEEPQRLEVHVNVDEWISGEIAAFPVVYLEPTGRPGTEIVLESVTARLREDRILRHLQRLPLGDPFKIWRNGELIPPRHWSGISKRDIDEVVRWSEGDEERTGRIHGEIWIRPPGTSQRDQAYISEPATEKEGLVRDAAGIEVRVNGDVITREFFGHETHGHGVNRIWGWVDADWLPILGNRTDYLRDHPAGIAFSDAISPMFDEAYRAVRYEQDSRAKRRSVDKPPDAPPDTPNGPGQGTDSPPETTPFPPPVETPPAGVDETIAARYGQGLNDLLSRHPEFSPVIESRAVTARGRPAKDRIYPARPAGRKGQLLPDPQGEARGILTVTENGTTKRLLAGEVARQTSNGETEEVELAEVVVNTPAGVRLRFVTLGVFEAQYLWRLDDPADLTLDINTDHKLYKELGRTGSPMHKLYCAWVVSMAMAERSRPQSGPAFAEDVERLAYELYTTWG